ncbi:MAG: replication-associated recombination protein A, partial [Muribaculaceae bacterium]|nr:replication-associated recombination protein A [Muribaculaceae bacterium]
MGIANALAEVGESGNLPVPLHLRNAPTQLMKDMGYGKDYKYSHNYANNYSDQLYLPEQIAGKRFWHAGQNPSEAKMQQRMDEIRKK